MPRLFDALALARGDGRLDRLLRSLARVELLILDDWGLSPLTADQRRDLLEILEDRHGRGSTMVTSQLPVEHWHEIVGDPTIADAILDRLVHNAHRLILKGESLRKAAAKIGPSAIALVEAIMKAKPHPEQGFRACLGILRLEKSYGAQRLEAACRRGNDIGATSYGSVASILKHGLDKAYAQDKAPEGEPIRHANIRGRGYYH